MKAWLGLIWQRLGPYLPILIMAVFALATFWLVRSMPTERGLAPEGPPSHEPDYFLVRFGWRNFGPGESSSVRSSATLCATIPTRAASKSIKPNWQPGAPKVCEPPRARGTSKSIKTAA